MVENISKKKFSMSKKTGLLYAALLFITAIFIHLFVNEIITVRIEIIYIFIGVLIGAGILLILQMYLKKV